MQRNLRSAGDLQLSHWVGGGMLSRAGLAGEGGGYLQSCSLVGGGLPAELFREIVDPAPYLTERRETREARRPSEATQPLLAASDLDPGPGYSELPTLQQAADCGGSRICQLVPPPQAQPQVL